MANCLHMIRRGAAGTTPLLVTHGLQCDTTFAALLARALPLEQPVYAFSAPGLDGREPPLTTIADMATRYVEDAAAVTGGGEVALMGFCAGSHVALEMAYLPARGGRAARHLYIVDTSRVMPDGEFDRLASEQISIAADRLVRRPELRRFFAGGEATVRAFTSALNERGERAYDGATTIVATTDLMPRIRSPQLGWRGFLPSTTPIVEVAETRAKLLEAEGLARTAAVVCRRSAPPGAA